MRATAPVKGVIDGRCRLSMMIVRMLDLDSLRLPGVYASQRCRIVTQRVKILMLLLSKPFLTGTTIDETRNFSDSRRLSAGALLLVGYSTGQITLYKKIESVPSMPVTTVIPVETAL